MVSRLSELTFHSFMFTDNVCKFPLGLFEDYILALRTETKDTRFVKIRTGFSYAFALALTRWFTSFQCNIKNSSHSGTVNIVHFDLFSKALVLKNSDFHSFTFGHWISIFPLNELWSFVPISIIGLDQPPIIVLNYLDIGLEINIITKTWLTCSMYYLFRYTSKLKITHLVTSET